MEKWTELTIKDGLVDISDPCYDRTVWCGMFDLEVKKGVYSVYYERDDDQVHLIALCQTDESGLEMRPWRKIGSVGVDAGLIGLYVAPKTEYNSQEWEAFCEEIGNGNTLKKENYVVVSTRFGDGSYPVYAKYDKNGDIVGLHIVC